MNQALKGQVSNLCREAHLKWAAASPFALLQIQITPRDEEGVSPFETIYGKDLLNVKGDQMHIKGQAAIN